MIDRPPRVSRLLTLWIGGDGVVCLSWGTWLAWHPAGHDRRQDRGCLARAVRRESVSFAVSHRITSAASEVTSSPTHPRGCAVGGGRAGRSRPPSVMSGAMHTLGNRRYARLGGGDKTWPLTTAVSRLPAVRVLWAGLHRGSPGPGDITCAAAGAGSHPGRRARKIAAEAARIFGCSVVM